MSQVKNDQCPEFPYFGASYPDARCIDGFLFDMDKCDDEGNLYEMGDCIPCPFCNTKAFLKDRKDDGVKKETVVKWMEQVKLKWG